ncbi:MAG: NUDIX hydrolase [SAR202 cluster bacterium]|nr:NUDIX hydrolase [SAR202 cluster bacterium]
MLNGDKFCMACATPLEARETAGRLRPVCPSCGRVVYYDPKIAATAIVPRQGKVLLIRRAGEVGYGLWSMPGGYVDRGEEVEAAAVREAWEETGLEVAVDRLVGVFSEAGHPVIVAAYAVHETGGELKAGPEALDVGFFSPEELPPLAFPRDALILERWREMRNGS